MSKSYQSFPGSPLQSLATESLLYRLTAGIKLPLPPGTLSRKLLRHAGVQPTSTPTYILIPTVIVRKDS
jgi:hypothetical protein